MSKDELLLIVKKVLSDNGEDLGKTMDALSKMADNDADMMMAFAIHGNDVVTAMNEAKSQTLQ